MPEMTIGHNVIIIFPYLWKNGLSFISQRFLFLALFDGFLSIMSPSITEVE